MATCTNCGTELSDLAVMCPRCGQERVPTHPSSPPTPAAGPRATDLRPLGIGEILDIGIKLYLRNAATLLPIVAIVVVPVQILGAFVQISALPDGLTGGFAQDGTPNVDFGEIGTFVAGSLVVGILSLIAQQIATAGSLKAVSDAYLDNPTDWRSSLRFATDRLGSLVWVAFLVSLLAGLALIACIAPGVWLWVAWSVAVPVLLLEGDRGMAAMSRSFALVKGRWWPTFGVIVVAMVVTFIVAQVINTVFGFALPAASGNLAVQFLSTAVGSAISSTLTIPFLAAVTTLIYFDLRVRKEGLDVALLAERIGAAPPPPVVPPPDDGGPLPPAPQAPPQPPSDPQGPVWESH